eukprot:scaffold37301_cov47-Attheya_sp.AAC.3
MYMPADVGSVGVSVGEVQPTIASVGLMSPALEMSQQSDLLYQMGNMHGMSMAAEASHPDRSQLNELVS